ncbi:DUF885 domain-containing protein [Nocardioides marmotae]|uniref:DUF885 domain-containing protein n=1 Tax=Nocardioides marmotae TaxID=2663857 RepID=UPI0013296E2A|nr:DUF885 domain-containing protein [Nocardioides marmotae]MBC9732768.1 DUF885 domain-containing protein [Nocardioides marmotae]MTB83883.1 DUF885 family protein [Nocardioides marmotae]
MSETPRTDRTGRTDRPVDAASDRYVEEYAALDPVGATYLGVAGHEHRLTDLSPAGYDAREELTRRALAEVTAATPTDEREAVARDAFRERLGLEVDRYDAGVVRSEVSVIASGLHELRQVFDLMDTGSTEGWEAVDARLAAVPAALEGFRVTLAEEAARGRVCATRQYVEVAEQVRGWTGRPGTGGVFGELVARSGQSGALQAGLEQHAAAASRALADTGLFLEDEMAPRGRERDAVGREAYALASRVFLGAEVDLEATYLWGWEELHRITQDMARTADRVLPGATVDQAVAALEADPARTIHGREAFRDWMQELADRTVAELDGVHFDIPEPARRIECMLAPTNDGGIYYTGPSEDFSRPGRMWWSVPDGIDDFAPWKEVTTVFHEGVPGHHLQVAQTAYRSELLNRWQRLMCWVSGHGEGWALYAERLMDDLGHLADPADRLGMLDAQGFRAARVVVDIGMHLELEIPRDNPFGFHPGERWTPDLGLAFMRQHSRMDDPSLRFEVKRYLGWPGQAPSYKVGERIWLEARDEARARGGVDFDLKAFHRAALDLGSLGLDPLKGALARL